MSNPALDALRERAQANPADAIHDIDRQLADSRLPALHTALLYSLKGSAYNQLEDDAQVRAAVDAARALAQPLPEGPGKSALLFRLRLLEADSLNSPAAQLEAAHWLVGPEAGLAPNSLDRACLLIVRSRVNAELLRDEEAAVDANTAWMLAHALNSRSVGAEAAFQLAAVYARYGLLAEADDLAQESTLFDRSRHLDSQLGDDLYLRADILHRLGRDDEALATLAEAREISQRLHEEINVAFDDQRECTIRIKQGEDAIARQRCSLAESTMRKAGRIDMAVGIAGQLAQLDLDANNAAGAIARLNTLVAADTGQIPAQALSELFRERSSAESRIGRWREAFEDMRKADELAGAASSSQSVMRAERIRTRVRAAVMEDQNTRLQREVADQRERALDQQRHLHLRQAIALAVIALACAVAYLMWWRARQEHRELEKKTILLKEIHHRVKNNLQVVSSLLNLQAREEDREEVRAFAAKSHSRIQAMALVHEQLYQAESPDSIAMDVFLDQLVTSIASAQAPGLGIRCIVHAQRILLPTAQASACGLIVNELVTNAFKHAFSPGDAGMIEVSMCEMQRQIVSLQIRDDGTAARNGAKRGFGLNLVKMLVSQLEGHFEIVQQNGMLFSMCFRVSTAN